jgi:hypothetical protein
MAIWDVYYYSVSGSTYTYANLQDLSGVTVTDLSDNSTISVQVGDTEQDSKGDNTGRFIGSAAVAGTPAYFARASFGFIAIYVEHGSPTPPASFTTTLDTTDPWLLCFAPGTLIATPDGERAVEALKAGDAVLTAGGAARPVRWLGQTTRARAFADPTRLYPIRILAGALGANRPIRDLLVSPGHAVLLDGVLVQAVALVNGTSVVRETDMPDIFTFYHVELDSHDLLIAEGVAAESFLMGVEDMGFDNLATREAPAGTAVEMPYPRVKSARQMPASVRALLAARAAILAPDVAAAA